MRSIFYIFSTLLLCISTNSECQIPNELWVSKHEGTSQFEDRGYKISFDNSGNVLVTGKVDNGCTFYDYITIKYNTSGDTLWHVIYDGTGDNQEDVPNALYVDDQNNVYVTGASDGSFQENIGTVKYNSSGIEQWSVRYTASISAGNDIIADQSGNVYVCGYEETSNDKDLILIKYNASGSQQWVRTYSNGFYDEGIKLMLDANDNIIITGISSAGSFVSKDVVTIKYDPAGNQQWLETWGAPIGSNYTDSPVDIGTDSTGNIYICASSYYQNTSNIDFVVIKYNSNGIYQWDINYDSPFNNQDSPADMEVDQFGNTYVTGISIGNGTMYDFCTVKFNNSGQLSWAQRQDSTMKNDYCRAIELDEQSNSLYITGDMNLGKNGIYDRRNIIVYNYDTSGTIIRTMGYQGPANTFDLSYDLTVNTNGEVFVTGISSTYEGGYGDVATLKFASNGNLNWERLWNGSGFSDDQGADMVADSVGYTYSCGTTYTNEYATGNDFKVVKTNPDGIIEWDYIYKGLQEISKDEARFIAIDDLGNVYVTGITDSTSAFQNSDIYTIKLSPSGNPIWEQIYQGPAGGKDVPGGIVVDDFGNTIVAATTVNPGTGFDGTLISYDPSGNINWTTHFDADSMPQGFNAIAIDPSQNIYCAGIEVPAPGFSTNALIVGFNSAGNIIWNDVFDSDSTSNFDSDMYNTLAIDHNGDIIAAGESFREVLLAKYTPGGSLQWIEKYDYSSGKDSASAITIDPFNNIIVAAKATLSFGSDYLIIKYDEQGNLIWDVNLINSPGSEDVPYDIVSDSAGSVYITGYETSSFTTNYNFLTVKYDSAGTFAWELIYSDSLGNSPDLGKRIALDDAGNLYIMGDANQPCWGNTFINGYRYDITTVKYGFGSGVGLQETNALVPDIIIFPNPVSESIQIKIPNLNSISVDVNIFDTQGRLVINNKAFNLKNDRVNISNLSNGYYTLQVTIDDQSNHKGKFVVSK